MSSRDTLLKYGLSMEVKFLNLVREHLGDTQIRIRKTADEFCCVDFVIVNEATNKKIVLELKSRTIDLNKKPNFLIAYKKLYNIKSEYKNTDCLLVWSDTFANVFYTKFTDELLNSISGIVCNQKCFFIEKSECNNGVDGLVEMIKSLLI